MVVVLFLALYGSNAQAAKLAEKGMEEKGKLITMDFEGVEIGTLIKFIGELTGKNFVVDERVRGKVTVISPTKLTVGEAYKVFESVLEVHGYTTVPAGKVIKVVPSTVARGKSLDTRVGARLAPPADSMITQVIPLQYADVNDIRTLFTPLIDKTSLLVAYQPTNTLIVTDVLSNINRLLKILREVDIPGFELQLVVIALQHASAEVIAQELKELFEARTRQPTVRRPQAKEVVEVAVEDRLKLIPDERTNSLIILATAQTIKMIRGIIAQLDQAIPRGKGYIHIYYLQHAVAEDLAKVLTGVAEEVKEGPKGAPPAPAGRVPLLGEKVSIIPDKATNSLVIVASPADYAVLESVIGQLDIVRAQVYVEALIAEVTLDKVKEVGVEWQITEEAERGKYKPYGGTNFGLTDAELSGALSGLIVGVTKGTISVGGIEVPNIKALIHALSADTDVNILSTPRLLTTDNEEAEIVVGEERPFLSSSQVTAEGSTVKTFEYKDVGITLKITPHISKGNLLRLELYTEITNFLEEAEGEVGAIVTTKRQATTSVVVEDGSTVVIGGLIRDDTTEGISKVPLLGDIPIAGWLFKTRRQTKVKTNLLIFITPRIVTSAETLKTISEKEQARRQRSLEEFEREKKRIFPLFDESRSEPIMEQEGVVAERARAPVPAPQNTAKEVVLATDQGLKEPTVEKLPLPASEFEGVAAIQQSDTTVERYLAPAQHLVDVSVDTSRPDSVVLRVKTDGRVEKYSSFALKEPTRLVIDLWQLKRRLSQKSVVVDSPYLKTVRLGDHPGKVRVVLDIPTEVIPASVIDSVGDELFVVLGAQAAIAPLGSNEEAEGLSASSWEGIDTAGDSGGSGEFGDAEYVGDDDE